MEDFKKEIEMLKNQLKTIPQNTLGYTLLSIDIREKEMLIESLSKLL